VKSLSSELDWSSLLDRSNGYEGDQDDGDAGSQRSACSSLTSDEENWSSIFQQATGSVSTGTGGDRGGLARRYGKRQDKGSGKSFQSATIRERVVQFDSTGRDPNKARESERTLSDDRDVNKTTNIDEMDARPEGPKPVVPMKEIDTSETAAAAQNAVPSMESVETADSTMIATALTSTFSLGSIQAAASSAVSCGTSDVDSSSPEVVDPIRFPVVGVRRRHRVGADRIRGCTTTHRVPRSGCTGDSNTRAC
jgi:hypothetical protein